MMGDGGSKPPWHVYLCNNPTRSARVPQNSNKYKNLKILLLEVLHSMTCHGKDKTVQIEYTVVVTYKLWKEAEAEGLLEPRWSKL